MGCWGLRLDVLGPAKPSQAKPRDSWTGPTNQLQSEGWCGQTFSRPIVVLQLPVVDWTGGLNLTSMTLSNLYDFFSYFCSAGFDAHVDDFYHFLDEADFHWLTQVPYPTCSCMHMGVVAIIFQGVLAAYGLCG